MIEYDYLIKRNEGDEIKSYRPDKIPHKLDDIVCIEGPNSSGKSTLLNLIAIGFHGLKSDKMNSSLKNKINDIIDSKYQKLQFEIKIINQKQNYCLISKKELDAKEIILKEIRDNKEKILTPETFFREYNLIYDIPDNPTERIIQLINEIKDMQKTYAQNIAILRSHIYNIITEIRATRDPKRIEELENQIEKTKVSIKKYDVEIGSKAILLQNMKNYFNCRFFIEYSKEFNNINIKIDKKEREMNKMKKASTTVDTTLQFKSRQIKNQLESMATLHRDIISLLKPILNENDLEHLNVWERIDFDKVSEEMAFPDSLTKEERFFRGQLNQIIEKNKNSMTETKIFTELIDLLKRYSNSSIKIPTFEIDINEFIHILEETNKKHIRTKILFDNINSIYSKFEEIEKYRRSVLDLLSEIKKSSKTMTALKQHFTNEDNNGHKELQQLIEERKSIKSKLDKFQTGCAKLDLHDDDVEEQYKQLIELEEIDPFKIYDQEQLNNSIEELENEISHNTDRIQKLKSANQIAIRELQRLQEKKPHQYQNELPKLDKIFTSCQSLEQKLSKQFHSYINEIQSNNITEVKEKEKQRYFEGISNYLGTRLGIIRHIEKIYHVKKVDIIDRVIQTEENKLIRLYDMGTGQSQAAYLMALLDTSDKRKIIALFDEIAMMDTKSLNPIYKQLNNLYSAGKLLVGIVVQKADDIKVISKIEG